MPTPGQPLVAEKEEWLQVRLEPVAVMFTDLLLLAKLELFPGLDPWVARTVDSLSAERRELHNNVINGLYYALIPQRSYPSFADYLAVLEAEAPEQWVDRLLRAYANMECLDAAGPREADRAELLADADLYLDYLQARFGEEHVDVSVERQAHQWLNDGDRMQREVMEHLHTMWREHLQPGWQQQRDLLEESVREFKQVGLPDGSALDVARWVTGQELKDRWSAKLAAAERVFLVPSAHVGPYVTELAADGTVWVVFGARTPQGAQAASPALSRSELLVRFNALADETRLHILGLLTETDELCAQDIMNRLELSQSTASRHLRQLSATGYLHERRVDSAKCYRLNRAQLQATVEALERFLALPSG